MLEAQISGNGFPMQPGHDCCTDFNFLPNELREKRDVRIAAMSGGGKFCLRKRVTRPQSRKHSRVISGHSPGAEPEAGRADRAVLC